ncbi:MAG: Eco57I restriction-modification methylase domain-containing protein, partial [Planctomycetaceae bacterium]|nr:Eco57I restriction-modification methylase domain-containing protein [Planctomycetaceae bacterium]
NFTGEEIDKIRAWNPFNVCYCSPFFDSSIMFGFHGFDIVIGNPPYLKEGRISKTLFEQYKTSPYYQGKMDLWYLFACKGIDYLKNYGILCFIATNNWTTSSGASKMRNKVISDTQIKQLLDFSNFMIFESASIQTMVMLFAKNSRIDNYIFDYRKLSGNTILNDVFDLLHKNKNGKTTYLQPTILRKNYNDKFLTFNSDSIDLFLNEISKNCVYLTEKEIAQGLVFPQDFLNKKNQKILGNNFVEGQGIFALSDSEMKSLILSDSEMKLIKPYFTTEQIHKYYSDNQNVLWIIYTDSSFKVLSSMDKYPKLKKHLDQFLSVFTSDNKPYGLHRAREEKFFKGEKVIVQRKCVGVPIFSYSDFDSYVSQTFFIIKTDRFNHKYLTGLLNSKLIAFWLRHKGKMQGENYQLDKEPLLQLPIPTVSLAAQQPIISLVEQIMSVKGENSAADTTALERKIDELVYELYGLSEEDIAVVERKNQ